MHPGHVATTTLKPNDPFSNAKIEHLTKIAKLRRVSFKKVENDIIGIEMSHKISIPIALYLTILTETRLELTSCS